MKRKPSKTEALKELRVWRRQASEFAEYDIPQARTFKRAFDKRRDQLKKIIEA